VNVDEMQKKLSQKAGKEPEHQFEDLYGLLCHEVWLRVAANKTLNNTGSRTAGIDTMTKSNFLGDFEGYISRLQMTLKARTFEPMPVRRVYIPHSATVGGRVASPTAVPEPGLKVSLHPAPQ
jgi:RNA-directed DNA polymerase